MFGFLDRQRLVKKGLASSKHRRRRTESELFQTLEYGGGAKIGIFVGFMLGLWALIYSDSWQQPTERGLIGLLIFLTALAQLWINHPNTWPRNSRVLLMFSVFLLQLTAVKLVLVTSDNQVRHAGAAVLAEFSSAERQQLWKLAVPFALAPLTLSVLLGKNHGIYAAIFASLWGAIIYRSIDAKFLVMSLITGFIAVFVTLQVRRRSRLIRAGFFVGVATWVLALLFGWIGPLPFAFGSVGTSNAWQMIGWQSLVAIGTPIVVAFIVGGGLIPVCEMLFGITTDIKWLELADLNHPLLKRMTIEAPGTYHHSLVVANLAEAAAEAIGANATMARVCSLFHDIGKLVKPEYYTENMRHDRNPHDELAPTMSALVIIAHVKEGVDLALKHGLNQQVIDVIQQHHGTSLVFFFYRRALQQQDDARAGGKIMNIREEDIPDVREESFRYGGPRPQTKECGIISLADCVESASRSLERITPQKIDQLISDIVEKRILDGQLKDCDLTLREIEVVGESFKFTLQSMMHSRVAYPSDRLEKHETPIPASKAFPMPAA
jgi:cyclic-di-AMP phosphodiesterase PgpH